MRARGGRARMLARAVLALVAMALPGCVLTLRDVPDGSAVVVREYLSGAARAPALAERVDTAPVVAWRTSAGRGSLGLPVLGERVTLVATVDRWIYALDTRTGKPFWRHRADAPFTTGPLVADGRVYAATDGTLGRVTAIALRNGRRRWTSRVGSVPAPLAIGDSAVFGITSAGLAFALRTSDGRVLWTRAGAGSRSGPILMGGRMTYLTLTDSLVTLDAGSGAIIARVGAPTSTTAPLARLDDSTVVVASPDGGVVALGVPGGAVRWRVATGAPVRGTAVVARDTVWALTQACTLWRIPVARPAAADSMSVGCVSQAAPTVLEHGVLVATVSGDVIFFDPATRQRVWTRAVRGPLGHPPLVRGGRILVAPILGDVVTLR